MTGDLHDLISVEGLMSRFGVDRRTIYRWKKDPAFPPLVVTASDGSHLHSWRAVKEWAISWGRWDDVAEVPQPARRTKEHWKRP